MTTQLTASAKLKLSVARLIVSAALVITITAITPALAPPSNDQEPKYEMGTFYVCLLIKPASFSPSKLTPRVQQHP